MGEAVDRARHAITTDSIMVPMPYLRELLEEYDFVVKVLGKAELTLARIEVMVQEHEQLGIHGSGSGFPARSAISTYEIRQIVG